MHTTTVHSEEWFWHECYSVIQLVECRHVIYNSFDSLLEPLTVNRLKGVKSVTATEDSIVGYMQDSQGNPGYMVVNFNDTTYKKKSDIVFTFANYNKAYVYIDGVKQDVTLKNNQLTLNLDIGEGVFVIPYIG